MERTEGGRAPPRSCLCGRRQFAVFFAFFFSLSFCGAAPGGSAASICLLFPFCSEVEQSGKRGMSAELLPSVRLSIRPSITGLCWCWASA